MVLGLNFISISSEPSGRKKLLQQRPQSEPNLCAATRALLCRTLQKFYIIYIYKKIILFQINKFIGHTSYPYISKLKKIPTKFKKSLYYKILSILCSGSLEI